MAFNVSFKKRESEDLLAYRDIRDDVIESEFVPYACHWNPHTLLTKNGELLQTIKIVGFTFESVQSQGVDLRTTIRQAIQKSLNTPDFAVWFHTIRRRKNLNPGGQYDEQFAGYVHESWVQQHDWEHKYINELFITVVRDGETGELKKPKRFMRSLLLNKDISEREAHLRAMYDDLQAATDRMLEVLSVYGAKRLGVFEKNGVYYSEPLRFLGKILKLHEEEVPLVDDDLSHLLATHDVTFGFDSMEVRSPGGVRRFGAILTIKEYRELSLAAIDEFLQLPEEFIVTQSMDFINHKQAYQEYRRQHQLSSISGDVDLAEISGLQEIVDSNTGHPTDYGEQQLTIFLLADDIKHLNRYIERTTQALRHLGIVFMREDMRLEDGYWAQLPGNFVFLKRLKPINAARIGGFANLSNFPAGKVDGNHWGPAVTIFNTAANTPYFFNFHNENVGHTSIIGPYGAGKTVLMNFLISEARKFKNKLFYFDQQHGAEIFIRALGGDYHTVSIQGSDFAMNPFQLPPSDNTHQFLLLWIESLLYGAGYVDINERQAAILEQAVAQVMALDAPQRTLRQFVQAVHQQEPALAQHFAIWYDGGSHAGLFDHVQDTTQLTGRIQAYEMGELVEDRRASAAVLLYLLHSIMGELDGTPAMIVLDEAWQLIDNPIFAPRLQPWLDALTARNALAIFATESVDDASRSALSQTIFQAIATQIYLPDEHPGEAYQTVFGLSDIEFRFLELMDSEERHFLLKKGEDTIVAKLSLDEMESIMCVLSAQPKSLELMHQLIKEYTADPAQWVPRFLEQSQEL